jgi:hypothetical protein
LPNSHTRTAQPQQQQQEQPQANKRVPGDVGGEHAEATTGDARVHRRQDDRARPVQRDLFGAQYQAAAKKQRRFCKEFLVFPVDARRVGVTSLPVLSFQARHCFVHRCHFNFRSNAKENGLQTPHCSSKHASPPFVAAFFLSFSALPRQCPDSRRPPA